MSFWKHHPPEFDEERFRKFLEGAILDIVGMIMADLTRLTNAVNAQGDHVTAVENKVTAQGARITDLEAQVAAGGGVDQAALDDLASSLEKNNDRLTAAGS